MEPNTKTIFLFENDFLTQSVVFFSNSLESSIGLKVYKYAFCIVNNLVNHLFILPPQESIVSPVQPFYQVNHFSLQVIFICASIFIVATNAGVLTAPQAYVTDTLHGPIAHTVEYHQPSTVEIHAPAVGTSSNTITRSFDGTVSHITKNVETPFSSVNKSVSKVSNKVYQPAYAYHAAAPAYATTYHAAQPAYTTTYHAAAPVATHYQAASPIATTYHAAATPVATTLAKSPILRAPQAHIAYSPSELVSHVVYDAPTIHYEW